MPRLRRRRICVRANRMSGLAVMQPDLAQQTFPLGPPAPAPMNIGVGFDQKQRQPRFSQSSTGIGSHGFEDEPPLLEELGINFRHIWDRTIAVMNPFRSIDGHILDDADLAGPLIFCLGLGFCQLFSGKLNFGYIFGLALMGCTALYMVLNLLSQNSKIDLFSVYSVVGYALLPIVISPHSPSYSIFAATWACRCRSLRFCGARDTLRLDSFKPCLIRPSKSI